MKGMIVKVTVEADNLDEVLHKAEKLRDALKEAKSLVGEMASSNCKNVVLESISLVAEELKPFPGTISLVAEQLKPLAMNRDDMDLIAKMVYDKLKNGANY